MRVRERNRRPDVDPPPGLFNAPRTSFNAAITPHRDFAFTSLSLPDVKMVKNTLGVSVNDVVLGVCAGALRKYLDGLDEHPDGPLVAMVPVSVRTDEQKGTHGNQVSSMLCSLATDIDDPVDRLLDDPRGHQRSEGTDQHHRRGSTDRLGRVRGAGTARPGGAAVLAHTDGRPSPAALQCDDLERAGPAVPACTPRAHG